MCRDVVLPECIHCPQYNAWSNSENDDENDDDENDKNEDDEDSGIR